MCWYCHGHLLLVLQALHAAAWSGHAATVRLLLLSGALIDSVDHSRHTPLSRACEAGHAGVVMALIENSARLDLLDDDGRTPLHWLALLHLYPCVFTFILYLLPYISIFFSHTFCCLTNKHSVDANACIHNIVSYHCVCCFCVIGRLLLAMPISVKFSLSMVLTRTLEITAGSTLPTFIVYALVIGACWNGLIYDK